jgi:biotin operon repressor
MSKVQAILADLQDQTGSDAEVARHLGVTRGRVWQIR